MASKRVFVSFDWEKDRHYKYLLNAWNSNPDFEFDFVDLTPPEINSDVVHRVRAGLTRRINLADCTLVVVGEDINRLHGDHRLIGCRNWQIFEIEQSKANGNKLAAVKLSCLYRSCDALLNCGVSWATSYTQPAIIQALRNAR